MNFNSSFDDIGNEAGIKDTYTDETTPNVSHEDESQGFLEQLMDNIFDDNKDNGEEEK